MDILHRGRIPEADIYHKATCNRCGTMVGYYRREARFEQDRGLTEGTGYLVIQCPLCKREIRGAVIIPSSAEED